MECNELTIRSDINEERLVMDNEKVNVNCMSVTEMPPSPLFKMWYLKGMQSTGTERLL